MMSVLRLTLIDVGWGESILLESEDHAGVMHYALIDSNDTTYLRSSFIFLKRFFERVISQTSLPKPVFEWVLLTHPHTDHGQGLKSILKGYGTKYLWFPKTNSSSMFFSKLLTYANYSSRVQHYQSIDQTKILPDFGDVKMKVLWPKYNQIDSSNENNNSVVLNLELNDISVLLTGDAELEVWEEISPQIPQNTRFFKVPHHGSHNGTVDSYGHTPWLNKVTNATYLGISCHVAPHEHPNQEVISVFNTKNMNFFRTDVNYHTTFEIDNNGVKIKTSTILP